MTELKPCPFCGAKVAEIRSNGIGDFYVICDADDDGSGREAGRFGFGCGARTSDVSCESREQAAKRWNMRA